MRKRKAKEPELRIAPPLKYLWTVEINYSALLPPAKIAGVFADRESAMKAGEEHATEWRARGFNPIVCTWPKPVSELPDSEIDRCFKKCSVHPSA